MVCGSVDTIDILWLLGKNMVIFFVRNLSFVVIFLRRRYILSKVFWSFLVLVRRLNVFLEVFDVRLFFIYFKGFRIWIIILNYFMIVFVLIRVVDFFD